MKKRIYALLLALCMVMNMASGVVLAEEIGTDDHEHDGHTHGEWVIEKEPTCTEEGLQKLYCADEDCGMLLHEEVIPMVPHTLEEEPCQNDYVDPTCTEVGHDWHHCAVCKQLLKQDGENWVLCDGNHEDKTCENCFIPATGHDFVDYPAVDATCTEDGNNAYRACSVCGFNEPGHEMEIIPAHGHGEGIADGEYTPKCDVNADDEHSVDASVPAVCPICGETLEYKIVIAVPHTWEAKEGLEPTCTEWGYTEYRECSVCGRIEGKADIEPLGHDFSKYVGALAGDCTTDARLPGIVCSRCDEGHPEKGPEYIPAPGHVEETVLGYAATCTEDGLTDGVKCSVCGETLAEQEVIPATGHTWKTVLGTKATCEADGEGAHRVCLVCGEKEYADPNVRIIPAHGHSNEDGYYPETPETVANGTAGTVREYRYDGYQATWITEEEAAKVKAATCTEDGYKANELCSFCNEVVVEGGVIPALGHDWELLEEGVLPGCTTEGISDLWGCTRCDLTMGGEVINARGHVMVAVEAALPTCEDEGNIAYEYCSVCGYAVAGTQEVVESKLIGTEYNPVIFALGEGETIEAAMPEEGHPAAFVLAPYACEYLETIVALDPTCTEAGIAEGGTRCLICEDYNVVLIPALDHPISGITVVAGQAPDCLNGGWVAYAWCDACDKAVALGDSYDIKGVKAALSISEIAMPEEGHPVEFLLDALGHAPKAGVAVDPTCTTGGHTAGSYCERCGLTLEGFEELDPLGHDMTVVIEPEVPAECTKDGKTAVVGCSRCDYVEGGEVIPATGHDAGTVTPVKPATCTEDGYGEGVHCTKCYVDYAPVEDYFNNVIDAAELYETGWLVVPKKLAALGHDMSNPITADATCEEVGYDNYSECQREGCDHTEGEIIPALGHVWINVPGGEKTAPTCTKAGTNGIQQCVRCLKTEAITVPALGHDWVKVEAVAATCAADGNIEYEYCSRCDLLRVEGVEYTEYDVVVKDDGLHDNLMHVDAVMPTCQTAGHSDGQYCDVCGYNNFTEIAADADVYHQYLTDNMDALLADGTLEWVVTSEGDGSVGSGMQSVLCPCCGHIIDVKLYPEVQLGDVNMDGRVNSVDALMILQYKAGVIETLPNKVAADYNNDGSINSKDALGILNSKIG